MSAVPPTADIARGPSTRLPASQLALFRNSLELLVQILDPIFELTVGALWKTRSYHVRTGRNILAALIWPVSHDLADSEWADIRPDPRCQKSRTSGRATRSHNRRTINPLLARFVAGLPIAFLADLLRRLTPFLQTGRLLSLADEFEVNRPSLSSHGDGP